MNLTHNRPFYKRKPIASMAALSRALGVPEVTLRELAQKADSLYRLAKAEEKDDGTIRQTFDAFPELKNVHRRIKVKIFRYVYFPRYLTGSLKGKDYVTNAKLHAGACIVINEDISSFFPSTTSLIVFDIWHHLFGFAEDVARCLTALTTKDHALPQGAITSSHLANLAFWREEPSIQARFAAQGIVYSRYVDDMALSSKTPILPVDKTRLIRTVYGMLVAKGYKPKRKKHEIRTSKGRMFVTKLIINKRPALTLRERAAIRTAVFQLEHKALDMIDVPSLKKEYRSVVGRVVKLTRFHASEGGQLSERLQALQPLLG